MGCSEKYSIVITILLVSIVVKSFGELIVVRHPPTDKGDTVKVTCLTKEVNAALIWNYDKTTGNVITIDSSTSSHLDGPNSPSTNGCEIGTLDSGSCFFEWKRDSQGWIEVNSTFNPMGPVHDYRWEGFKELTIVRQSWVTKPITSYTVVFSARESKSVDVRIYKQDTVRLDLCIRIVIESSSDGWSRIQTCRPKVSNGSPTEQLDSTCTNIQKQKPDRTKGLKMYEWHTYRIEYDVKENTVRVFENDDEAPFLQGLVGARSNTTYYYAVGGDLGTRIRFHDYTYQKTRLSNAVISTATFQTRKENICFVLTFGLCSHCSMKISLFDETNNATIDEKTILGNNRSTTNGVLTWQSRLVKLSIKKPQINNLLSLKIQTFLNDTKKGEGHWAIDKVRLCQPRGTIRASTITIRKPETPTNEYQPPIVCQKISHRGSGTIDLNTNFTRDLNTSHLEEMLKVWRESCGSSCEGFGKGSLICNSTECSCDRGFQGANCTEECTLGSYGYNCSEKCEYCKDEKCNKETGHCEDGCVNVEFEPSLCQINTSRFNAVWLTALPVAVVILLAVFFIIRRCSKKRNCAPLQVSYGEFLPSRQENASMEYEVENSFYGTPICQSSTPSLNPQNRESLSHVYAVPFVPQSGSVSMMGAEEYIRQGNNLQ